MKFYEEVKTDKQSEWIFTLKKSYKYKQIYQ